MKMSMKKYTYLLKNHRFIKTLTTWTVIIGPDMAKCE